MFTSDFAHGLEADNSERLCLMPLHFSDSGSPIMHWNSYTVLSVSHRDLPSVIFLSTWQLQSQNVSPRQWMAHHLKYIDQHVFIYFCNCTINLQSMITLYWIICSRVQIFEYFHSKVFNILVKIGTLYKCPYSRPKFPGYSTYKAREQRQTGPSHRESGGGCGVDPKWSRNPHDPVTFI